ncbi:hypothetical protein CHS0354_029138 [Potamilus streckersoni]|uniref:Uncharacterized protein n=1 Tax=Potamilus streckersoni TaxID=2493646 RepID=A0AAE0SWT9_9BIVA|nr:hypothetical protein CHS0354_029138 [Potamilus streckersoni]
MTTKAQTQKMQKCLIDSVQLELDRLNAIAYPRTSAYVLRVMTVPLLSTSGYSLSEKSYFGKIL